MQGGRVVGERESACGLCLLLILVGVERERESIACGLVAFLPLFCVCVYVFVY